MSLQSILLNQNTIDIKCNDPLQGLKNMGHEGREGSYQ